MPLTMFPNFSLFSAILIKSQKSFSFIKTNSNNTFSGLILKQDHVFTRKKTDGSNFVQIELPKDSYTRITKVVEIMVWWM